MKVYDSGIYREATPEEIAAWEEAASQSAPLPSLQEQMFTFARSMVATAITLTDEVVLSIPDLTAPWVVGEAVIEGNVRRYLDKTYRCRQDHTTQADWTPDATPAMWVVIELVAAGTIEDPITASRGMEYVYGKYYKDPEDGKLYLCKRIGEEDGGAIILQYLPHELVGQYFDEVVT